MVKTKYFNLTNYALGSSGNVLIRKQIEDRQVNDKYLAFVNSFMEFYDIILKTPDLSYLGIVHE